MYLHVSSVLYIFYNRIHIITGPYECIVLSHMYMYTYNALSVCLQAIWFTKDPGTEGPVFGNTEIWHGLGVMLDSFDNDGLVSEMPLSRKSKRKKNFCKFSLSTKVFSINVLFFYQFAKKILPQKIPIMR